jgi:hypothetical protein
MLARNAQSSGLSGPPNSPVIPGAMRGLWQRHFIGDRHRAELSAADSGGILANRRPALEPPSAAIQPG